MGYIILEQINANVVSGFPLHHFLHLSIYRLNWDIGYIGYMLLSSVMALGVWVNKVELNLSHFLVFRSGLILQRVICSGVKTSVMLQQHAPRDF